MDKMKCPTCGSQTFYVKDPDDDHTVYVFRCEAGEVCFDPEIGAETPPEIEDHTETYCNNCSWHDSFQKVKIDFK